MKFFQRAVFGLTLFVILLCAAVLGLYYAQGAAHQGLTHSDFADRPFEI
jgi:hypothetical protein